MGMMQPSRIYMPQTHSNRDRIRTRLVTWRKWYNTARWKRLRLRIFERDGYTCQICKDTIANTSRLVADHKIAHRGDERMFWDEANIETLCKPCHDSTKQRQETGR
jgi:5-methylcytosine-specific restriction protein A